MRCVYVLLPDPRGGFPGVRRDDKGEEFRFQPTYLFPLFPFSPGKKLAGIIGKLDDLFRERTFENGGSGGRPDRENETDPFSLFLFLVRGPYATSYANRISMKKLRFEETSLFTIIVIIVIPIIGILERLEIVTDLRESFLSSNEIE